jgi:hypothetical protein
MAMSAPPTTLSLEIELMSKHLEKMLQNGDNAQVLSDRERKDIQDAIDTFDKDTLSALVARFLPAVAISDQIDLGSEFIEKSKLDTD